MLRIALRVRLRFRSAQDDTKGSKAEDFKKNNPSVTLPRATADCQASATPKNASKGERHPKHFLGLKLIDKTILCKSSLLKV